MISKMAWSYLPSETNISFYTELKALGESVNILKKKKKYSCLCQNAMSE